MPVATVLDCPGAGPARRMNAAIITGVFMYTRNGLRTVHFGAGKRQEKPLAQLSFSHYQGEQTAGAVPPKESLRDNSIFEHAELFFMVGTGTVPLVVENHHI
jgi:hypothetical protein